MSKDDIIRMAREAGFAVEDGGVYTPDAYGPGDVTQLVKRFAALVYESIFRDANIAASRTILDAAVLEEREACAKVCEARADEEVGMAYAGIALDCAAAIRARSNT
jgi:hypothetical protein